jgi:hypothetical protein
MAPAKIIARIMVATALALVPALLSTANAGPVAFELRLSENANVTVDPNNSNILQQAGNAQQLELFSQRDTPFVQLMNTSPPGSTAEIVRFSLTIGDLFNNSNNFDWVRMFDYSPGITWQFAMPDEVNGNVRSDAIDILFTGFTPGKLVRFQTDIDNDQGNVDLFTDFRQVLFDLGGSNKTDNAFASVQFQEPGLPATVVSDFLPDFAQLGPTNLGFRLISECGPESVQPYIAAGVGQVVPEPATWALLSSGLLALGLGLAKRRHRAAN